jgi:hypothetical protein
MLKFALEQAMKPQWGKNALHAPAAEPPGKRPVTHCLGGWMVLRAVLAGEENPSGFDPLTVQPVASSYTD